MLEVRVCQYDDGLGIYIVPQTVVTDIIVFGLPFFHSPVDYSLPYTLHTTPFSCFTGCASQYIAYLGPPLLERIGQSPAISKYFGGSDVLSRM